MVTGEMGVGPSCSSGDREPVAGYLRLICLNHDPASRSQYGFCPSFALDQDSASDQV